MIISNLITVNHTSNLYPTKVCMFILHNLRDSSISPSTFTLHFMKEVVLIYQWLFIRTCIHNQEINTNYEIVNCKTFFVSSVTRYLLSIRCPTTHTISSPEIINQLCSFSIILSLLSIKKSLFSCVYSFQMGKMNHLRSNDVDVMENLIWRHQRECSFFLLKPGNLS